MREHWYKNGVLVPAGTKGAYPSVTTVLNAANQDWYVDMARRMGFEDADRFIDEAKERGSEVHSAIEDYELGAWREDLSDIATPFFNGYLAWKSVVGAVTKSSELYLESTKYKYAGTADLISEIEGAPWLIDIKTTSQHKKEHGLQLKAYQQAYYEMHGIRPRMAILKLTDKTQKGWQWREYTEPLKPFLGLLDYYKWTVRKRKAVVEKVTEAVWAPKDILCRV